jgi:hypothetical protein
MYCVCRNFVALYTNITRIKWNYKPGRVAGSTCVCVCVLGIVRSIVADTCSPAMVIPGRKDVVAFAFDQGELSKFDVANRLWDMMGTE